MAQLADEQGASLGAKRRNRNWLKSDCSMFTDVVHYKSYLHLVHCQRKEMLALMPLAKIVWKSGGQYPHHCPKREQAYMYPHTTYVSVWDQQAHNNSVLLLRRLTNNYIKMNWRCVTLIKSSVKDAQNISRSFFSFARYIYMYVYSNGWNTHTWMGSLRL